MSCEILKCRDCVHSLIPGSEYPCCVCRHLAHGDELFFKNKYENEPLGTSDDSVKKDFGIIDSGARQKFDSGAVRDISESKGRCDLLPLDVVAALLRCYDENKQKHTCIADENFLLELQIYITHSDTDNILDAALIFVREAFGSDIYTALLELSKHYEAGAKKYAPNNWKLGIPLHCYIDSTIRHYLKWLRGDKDEPHERAVLWNLLGAFWTHIHKPELRDINELEETAKC